MDSSQAELFHVPAPLRVPFCHVRISVSIGYVTGYDLSLLNGTESNYPDKRFDVIR